MNSPEKMPPTADSELPVWSARFASAGPTPPVTMPRPRNTAQEDIKMRVRFSTGDLCDDGLECASHCTMAAGRIGEYTQSAKNVNKCFTRCSPLLPPFVL